jgi:hypothetical protein
MSQLATYRVAASLAGAANKVMLAVLNPAGSGKIIRVKRFSIFVPSSSGTEVVVHWEARMATAFSGGTAATPTKADSADAASAATCLTGATTITPTDPAQPLVEDVVVQINTFQSPDSYRFDLAKSADEKPVVLRAGEGFYLKQIESNTSTHKVGIVYTEEAP